MTSSAASAKPFLRLKLSVDQYEAVRVALLGTVCRTSMEREDSTDQFGSLYTSNALNAPAPGVRSSARPFHYWIMQPLEALARASLKRLFILLPSVLSRTAAPRFPAI